MFLTITIDTAEKKRYNPIKGWHHSFKMKKDSFWKKLIGVRKSLRDVRYKLGDQVAMF